MKDQFNREIDYLRISVTDRCNYNCRYCKPTEEVEYETKDQLTNDEILEIAKAASFIGVKKIRITGGEPMMRPGITELIRKIKAIEAIEEVVMTTNAALLYKKLDELKQAGLSRVNLSLDSLDPVKFKYITNGGNLEDVKKSIDKLLELDMRPVKINVVLMKGINDTEILDFIEMTKNDDIIVRFIELMPIGSHHDFSFKKHFLSNDEVLKQCKELVSDKLASNETATYYRLPGAKGKVGLISAISHHFCATCNRLRITSDGLVKSCLHENKEYDLLKVMREGHVSIEDFLRDCIKKKPKSHKINQKDFEKVGRDMYKIGG